jgi:benzoylformate decarboxylase
MKELVKRYLDNGISRRSLMRGLGKAGMTAAVAKTFVESFTPAEAATTGITSRNMTGNGGMLYMQQLKAAGVEYVFFNPSTGDAPFYDAAIDIPEIQLIKGIHEGAVVAMADGYARLSGKIGVAHIANVGLPNGLTQLVNSWKDRIPVLLTVAAFGTELSGRDGPQDFDHQESMVAPITKWLWLAENAQGIPDVVRRAMKFAATTPSGPVFLSIPDDFLRATITADIVSGQQMNVALKIRPAAQDVDTIARMLIEAKNPLMSVGDEVTTSQGEAELYELATLLGLPVTTCWGSALASWSRPFPTQDRLFIGSYQRQMGFPGEVDLHFIVGDQMSERPYKGATSISMRSDPTALARAWPIDLPVVSNLKLGLADIIAAVKSLATPARIKTIADQRSARVAEYSAGVAKMRATIMKDIGNASTITMERLGAELETGLDPTTIFCTECDSGRNMDPFLSFGGTGKKYISTGPNILGWAQAAAFGAKLAQPDHPVVSVTGDGGAMFGGPQPLWSQARYSAPVTNLVINNRSYNNERNRIWSFIAGEQYRTGIDMTCYNGTPDVDFVKAASGYGVEGEKVSEPGKIQEALARSKKANVEGRPFLLEILVDREGIGAASAWHPPFSIADKRTRKV